MPPLSSSSSSHLLLYPTIALVSLVTAVVAYRVMTSRRRTITSTSHKRLTNAATSTTSTPSPESLANYHLEYLISSEITDRGLAYIFKCVFPASTSGAELEITQIQGGITNLLWKVRDPRINASALIRVYGANTELMIDRNLEIKIFDELSARGFGPKLYGCFRNGRVEGYFENSRNLDFTELGMRHHVERVENGEAHPGNGHGVDFPKLIAAELVKMHAVRDMPVARQPCIWSILTKWIELASHIDFPGEPKKQALLASMKIKEFAEVEIPWLRARLPSPENAHGIWLHGRGGAGNGKHKPSSSERAAAVAFRRVFSHNDLLSGNILYLRAEKRCQFIDFEYGAYNYLAFDFANHFCEYAGFDFDFERHLPSKEAKAYFWKCYLEAEAARRRKATNDDEEIDYEGAINEGDAEDEDLVRELVAWTDRFMTLPNAMWFLWAVLQAKHSVIEVDFLEYAEKRRRGYFHCKDAATW